jgi:DNA-binding transcriptional LysR family regulator
MSQSNDTPDPMLARSDLKLRHMRVIIALEETGQVSAAAARLNMSQPAASRMITEMEALLEAPLCERLSRGISLTPYGKAFARRARAVLLELREAGREIAELRTGHRGAVAFGAVTGPSIDMVVPALTALGQTHPGIGFTVVVETSDVLGRALIAGDIDFYIGRVPDGMATEAFDSLLLGPEAVCFVARADHPLAKSSAIALEGLSDYQWVLQPPGSLLRRTIDSLFAKERQPLPARILNTSSALLTQEMVRNSQSIAPVSLQVANAMIEDQAGASRLAILDIDFEITLAPLAMVTARGRTLSPSALVVHDALLEAAKKTPPS